MLECFYKDSELGAIPGDDEIYFGLLGHGFVGDP